MAVFTVIFEFDGGTYISQFHASPPKNAARKHSAHLVEIKGMSALAIRRRLADRLSSEVPIAIAGIRKVWCCRASVGKRLALLNIVATA
jgi:hypothetical protein